MLVAILVLVALLKVSDRMSMRAPAKPAGSRLLCANVKDEPLAVLKVIKQYLPDVVALQETGPWTSCATLAREVGYDYWSGSDQCVLAHRHTAGAHTAEALAGAAAGPAASQTEG
jgi:hypothetical protein